MITAKCNLCHSSASGRVYAIQSKITAPDRDEPLLPFPLPCRLGGYLRLVPSTAPSGTRACLVHVNRLNHRLQRSWLIYQEIACQWRKLPWSESTVEAESAVGNAYLRHFSRLCSRGSDADRHAWPTSRVPTTDVLHIIIREQLVEIFLKISVEVQTH